MAQAPAHAWCKNFKQDASTSGHLMKRPFLGRKKKAICIVEQGHRASSFEWDKPLSGVPCSWLLTSNTEYWYCLFIIVLGL